ncbi:MAG: copper oxidase [Candidatus Nephthysia bennettiae]|uniref:Multicopper oxidase domain-containing protein n=1 Tax=Candidatus Nephthysia bennettiae TaxID=3127016 RepID=A0A934K358_9BACT|nr:multicopper oxidase domain-containing protein [Candidatus Dormibacteraeota bacterium]MBJ7612053.1 multicopper oxidase domain-containing protein [Candidatus Dormibacteraeota bacterium]PZR99525.1 MAG: copper oxidase [Candidatus Dormibacteraeota bacterium]
MTHELRKFTTRRSFLKAAGVTAAGLAGLGGLELARQGAAVQKAHPRLVASPLPIKEMTIGFSDGWVSMPQAAEPVPPFFPDPAAPRPFTTYVMGIRDLTGMSDAAKFAQKGHGAITGPFLFCEQGQDFRVHLHNLGLSARSDLIDSHTLHWHGFPNQIVYFDGVPDNSLAVPIGRELTYRYIPEDPGTYMYHCHVEDVEHVHMGLTGLVFVRPELNRSAVGKYAYNDPATLYHREYGFLLSEIDNHAHFNDKHVQDTDWSDYKAAFRLMNGRAFPDTLQLNLDPTAASLGNLERLRYQPHSALIQANEGDRVLIRISNLGFEERSMVLSGIEMTLVGADAKPLTAGRPDYGVDPPAPGSRADISSKTYRLDLGPGESRDAIFTAPKFSGGSGPDIYPFYDRNYGFVDKAGTGAGDGYGGQRTEVRVYPQNTLPEQTRPNGLYDLVKKEWTWATGT